MSNVVGIRFKQAGKVYYFDPADMNPELNTYVVVETTHGEDLGRVVIAPTQVLTSEITEPLKQIVRKATDEDIQRADELRGKGKQVLIKSEELVSKHHLPMKLVAVEYSLDGGHLTIFFCAEERVDFRELVREISHTFATHVELRQVGPRDEAKLIGGVGRCGRPLCCVSFLDEFNPVSIRMAKEQNLPLNPMKISGVCGRLLCCLSYENEQYRCMKEKLPKEGQQVTTPSGKATVISSNVLMETVLVETENQTVVEFPFSQLVAGKESAQQPRQKKSKRRR